MDAQESSGWWFVGKRFFVRSMLSLRIPAERRGPLLDAGCGTGATLRTLAAAASSDSPAVTSHAGTAGFFGLDPAPDALHFARNKCGCSLVCGSAESSPFANQSFGTVLLLDVLEHLDDDRGALRDAYRILEPGGYLVLTTPAFPFLWSGHDVALHHRRRYLLPQVDALLEDTGFERTYLGHAFASIFPVAVAVRLGRRLLRSRAIQADVGTVNPVFNRLLTAIVWLESRLCPYVRFSAGTSILALARRPMAGD
jgi:SAM-dependent methyltransferase